MSIPQASREEPYFVPQSLTPVEQEVLAQLGWKPGEPVPKNLAQRIAESDPGAGSGGTPSKPSQSVRVALAEAKMEYEQARRREEQMPEQPAPGVREALEQIRSGAMERIDLSEESRAETKPEEAATGIAPSPAKRCPRCDWDLGAVDSVEVGDDDKRAYLAAFLGGEPFRKTYRILGGKMEIDLRELTSREVDMCYQQLSTDRRQQKFVSEFDALETLMRYRLVLQLAAVRSERLTVVLPESAEEWEKRVGKPSPAETCLPNVHGFVLTEVVRSESLLTTVTRLAAEFNRLVAKLAAAVFRPDF